MGLHWRAGVHAVAIDEDLVLLDEASDAYVCLLGGAKVLAGRGRTGRAGAPSDEGLVFTPPHAADDLVAAGLLSAQPPPRVATGLPPPARSRLYRVGGVRPSLGESLTFLRLAAGTARDIARRPMGGLLEELRGQPLAPAQWRSLAEACAVFDRLIAWGPFDGACLFRSVLRRRFLAALGHPSLLVLGVRTWPFRAHCWLQSGQSVLDDWPERVAAYRPILVV